MRVRGRGRGREKAKGIDRWMDSLMGEGGEVDVKNGYAAWDGWMDIHRYRCRY